MIQMEIIGLLIGTDIQGTNNHLFAAHALYYFLISLILFFLCGIILTAQIHEFTPEQTDSSGIAGQYLG